MANTTEENITDLPKERSHIKEITKGTGSLIDKTGNYAHKNNLPPVMTYSMFGILVAFIAIIIITVWPNIDTFTRYFSITAISVIIMVLSKMAFSVYKEHKEIDLRSQKRNKKPKQKT